MPRIFRLVSLCAFGVVGLAICMAGSAECRADQKKKPAKPAAKQPPAPNNAAKIEAQRRALESALLRYSYVLLAAANGGGNGGHRTAALKEVVLALRIVDAQAVKTAAAEVAALNNLPWRKILLKRNAAEFDPVSNAQIFRAGELLTVCAKQVNRKTQANVLPHVQGAINEVVAALKVNAALAAKVTEGQLLTTAYVLLCATNNDYGSHRQNVKAEVEFVCAKLQGILLAAGGVQQQIQAVTSANTKFLAGFKDKGLILETQRISDNQMLMADSLIQRAASMMAGRSGLLGHLARADKEISLALMIR